MNDDLFEKLKRIAEVERDVPLSTMTTLRIGGPARYVVYPDSTVALDALMRLLKEESIQYKVIGKGSNLLCSDREFEGVVIRVDRKGSHTARIVVRKVTSGVGVEKSYLIHSPLVEKIEITKRSKVRRNNLSYLRERSGKSARLAAKDFDRAAVNKVTVPEEAEVEVVETPVEEATEATAEKATEVPAEEAKEEKAEA